MSPNPLADRRDGRAVSNQVAVVLLIGMVVTGAVVVSLVGTQSLMDLEDQIRGESGEKSMREVDARVSSLAVESSTSRVTLDFGDQNPSDIHVSQRGHVNVSIDRKSQCSANVSLSSVRYDEGGSSVRAFEMGGIWVSEGDASAMASPPQITFEEGSLALTVTNFTGAVDGSSEVITKDVAASDAASRRIQRTLQRGPCARPDNVTVTIQSDFHGAYYSYLEDELDYTSIDHWDSNRTVRAYIGQEKLPAATNDSRNQVVNLSGSAYNDVEATNNSIEVEKGAPVNYSLGVRPIAKGVEVSEIHDFEDQTIYRQPLDVVFVVDESGSMAWDANTEASGCSQGSSNSGCTSKKTAAEDAMKSFVGLMNSSKDRVGLVGFHVNDQYKPGDMYDDNAHTYRTDNEHLTRQFDDFNDTIDTIEAGGGTYMNAGMREGTTLMDLGSNSSRERVLVMLSDGENSDSDDDDETEYWADRAGEQGTAVYTIGFGAESEIDEDLLETMADGTGGRYYYAKNSSRLSEVFRHIASEVTETEAIARPPVSMNVSAGSQAYYPQISGNTSHVASGTGPDGEPVLNVNDPTTPEFSFSLTVPDGTNVSMNSMAYTCDRWEATSQTVVNQSTNETYLVTRCAELDESSEEVLEPSNASIYTDGDDVSSLVDEREAWFQSDLNETLIPYRNGTTLDLPSNQAIVVFDYEDDDKADNRLVMLFQLGYAESKRSAGSVVQMNVNNVTVGA